jgi:hypothetical protein
MQHTHDDDGTVEGCPGCFAGENSRETLEHEADYLYAAMEIISRRFPSGRYEETRLAIRKVAAHLQSLARHPSRQKPT